MGRSRRRRVALPLAVATIPFALAALPAGASALAVSVTGDDGSPVGIDPAAPPTIRNLRPTVAVTPDPGGRYSVTVTGPDGKAAASPVTCQDPTRPSSVPLAFHGDGRSTIAVTVYAIGDAGCSTPAGPAASFPFTTDGRVVLGPIHRFVERAPGSTRVRALALPVDADPGSQTREVRFAANAKLTKAGAIRGRSIRAPYKNGTASLRFPAPGTYTVVARDEASGVETPWSDPLRIRVVTPFTLTALRFPDATGPRFHLAGTAIPGATGAVSVALARARGAFHGIGRARIDAHGRFGVSFTVRRAGSYRVRFTYRGNRLVTPGRVVRAFRVGTAISGLR